MNDIYFLIPYPDVQKYMEEPWFDKEAHLIENSAYFIPYFRIVDKEKLIESIKDRIESEHRKFYKSFSPIDWIETSARKIVEFILNNKINYGRRIFKKRL